MLKHLQRLHMSINPRHSLRTRLGLAVGGVALALLILLSLLVGYVTKQQLEADTGRFLSELAYQMADKLDRGMFERYRDIQIVASLETLGNPNSTLDTKRALLEKLQNTYTDYAWIGLANLEGKVIVSTGKILQGKNVSKRPWFIHGQKSSYVGDVHDALLLAKILPNSTGEPMRFVDITAVVTDQDKPVGVLGAHLNWVWAKKVQDSLLQSRQKYANIEMLVLNKNGDVLMGPPSNKGKLSELESFQAARRGKNNYLIETWYDRNNYVTGFAPSVGYLSYPGLGWVVLVRQKTDIAFAPARSLQRKVLIWGVVFGLVSGTLSWLLTNRIVNPILAITVATHRIRSGDVKVKIPMVRGQDEVAILSAFLSYLMTSLENHQAELNALNEQLQQDITARQQAEAEVRTLNEELEVRVQQRTMHLEAANKELEAFSYSASHDLRAPLNRIHNFSQILMEDYANQLDTVGKDCLARIFASSQQMEQLIESLLQLAQVSRSEMHYQKVDLSDMVQAIATNLQKAEPHRQVEFSIANDVTAYADAWLIHCVLENLLGNAWKYTRKQSQAEIEFGVLLRKPKKHKNTGESQNSKSKIQAPKSMIYFFRDNGAGFDIRSSHQLFKPFKRLHSASEFEGNGIGLATVQQIIHRHKGQIWAQGKLGQGATFYFTLNDEENFSIPN
ncbi:HAMP domain-containing protein [Scytonema tolypothrichoides VB-61278]|nr:HAMP domain-containing protein [Scytonema tolypothrichoides VB-61278]